MRIGIPGLPKWSASMGCFAQVEYAELEAFGKSKAGVESGVPLSSKSLGEKAMGISL